MSELWIDSSVHNEVCVHHLMCERIWQRWRCRPCTHAGSLNSTRTCDIFWVSTRAAGRSDSAHGHLLIDERVRIHRGLALDVNLRNQIVMFDECHLLLRGVARAPPPKTPRKKLLITPRAKKLFARQPEMTNSNYKSLSRQQNEAPLIHNYAKLLKYTFYYSEFKTNEFFFFTLLGKLLTIFCAVDLRKFQLWITSFFYLFSCFLSFSFVQ